MPKARLPRCRNISRTLIEVDGTTNIPVAVTSCGFGAGEGGVGFSVPIGVYGTRDGVTRFHSNTVPPAGVGISLTHVVGHALVLKPETPTLALLLRQGHPIRDHNG